MRRVALVLVASSCVAAPSYVGGTGGSGGAGAGSSVSGSSAGGFGGAGGVVQVDPPAPALCRFHGTVNNESLYDLRRNPSGNGLVAGGGFSGPLVFDSAITAASISDGYVARLDVDGNANGAVKVGITESGSVGAVIPTDSGRTLAVGTLRGDIAPLMGDPGATEDAFITDPDSMPILVAGTAAADGLFDGQAFGGHAFVTGDSDAAGLDLGTGPLSSGGFVAVLDLARYEITAALPLGAGSVAGSGHNVRVTSSGEAWASVALGGPGVTDVVCNGESLVTTAPRQPAILKVGSDGVCTVGRVLPSSIFEDVDLAVIDGTSPVLSGYFTGAMTIDGIEVTSDGDLYNAFLAVFDAEANLASLTAYGGPGAETTNEIIIDDLDRVFVTGQFTGSFRAGTMTAESYPDGEQDIFVMRFTRAGDIVWATAFGGPGYQASSAIAIDEHGNLFVGGNTLGSIACASPAPELVGETDIFLMRFDAATL
jgi:hypothetical protein